MEDFGVGFSWIRAADTSLRAENKGLSWGQLGGIRGSQGR